MKIDHNVLMLVKALVKVTSAVTDIDELKDNAKYRFLIKKDLNNWQEWIEEHTKDSLIKLTKADDSVLIHLINMYDDFEDKFKVKDEYTSRVLLFLAKVHSALRDINRMEPPYNQFIGSLKYKFDSILDKAYLKVFIVNHNKEFNSLLASMNKLSDEEIVGSV